MISITNSNIEASIVSLHVNIPNVKVQSMAVTFGTLYRGLQAESQLTRAARDYPAHTCAKQLWKWLTSWIKGNAFKQVLPVLLENLENFRGESHLGLQGPIDIACYFSSNQYLQLRQIVDNGSVRLELKLFHRNDDRLLQHGIINSRMGTEWPLEHLRAKLAKEYLEACSTDEDIRYYDYSMTFVPRPVESVRVKFMALHTAAASARPIKV